MTVDERIDEQVSAVLKENSLAHLLDCADSFGFCRQLFFGGYESTERLSRHRNITRDQYFIYQLDMALCGGGMLRRLPLIGDYDQLIKVGRLCFDAGCTYWNYWTKERAAYREALNRAGYK